MVADILDTSKNPADDPPAAYVGEDSDYDRWKGLTHWWLSRMADVPRPIAEKMTWFWMNHFNVFLYKGNIRATIADYEDAAIRPRAWASYGAAKSLTT